MRIVITILASLLLASCAGPVGDLPRFHEVDAGKVYRSAQPDAIGYETMQKAGIRTVIKLNTDLTVPESQWAARSGIRLIEISLNPVFGPNEDEENRVQTLLLDRSLWPILFHCEQGQDRTGLVAALYRVYIQGWTPAAAYEEWIRLGHSVVLAGMDAYFWSHMKATQISH